MARAMHTLTLMRLPGPHPFQDALPGAPAAFFRDAPPALPAPAPELARSYRRFGLGDVFLGFAGYRHPGHPVHGAIAALSAGDVLQVRAGSDRWELLEWNGVLVGQLPALSDLHTACAANTPSMPWSWTLAPAQ